MSFKRKTSHAEVQNVALSFVFCQITKALSVRVLSEVHEEQEHPPEAHQEVRLVPPTSQ